MGCGGSRPSAIDRRRSRDRGSRRSYDHSSRSSQRQRYSTSRPNERTRASSLRQPQKECCCNTVNFSAYQYPEQQCQCQCQQQQKQQQQHYQNQTQSQCYPDISDILSQTSTSSEMPASTSNCCCNATQGNQGSESECDCDDVVQRGADAGCKTVVCLTFNPPRQRRNC